MAMLNLSSPWVRYYRMVQAFFKEDPGIRVVYDEQAQEIKLYVADPNKALELERMLVQEVDFGSVKLRVTVAPGNQPSTTEATGLAAAFDGNEAVSRMVPITCPIGNWVYVAFKPEVVQYFADNLGDLHGYQTTLNADIAKEIFKQNPEYFFCTDLDDTLVGALTQWP